MKEPAYILHSHEEMVRIFVKVLFMEEIQRTSKLEVSKIRYGGTQFLVITVSMIK